LALALDIDNRLAVVGVAVAPPTLFLLGLDPSQRVPEPEISGVPEFGEDLEVLRHVSHVAGWKAGLEPGACGFGVS
jgi:hypothetical protein